MTMPIPGIKPRDFTPVVDCMLRDGDGNGLENILCGEVAVDIDAVRE